jgi:hypothetical protein
MRQGISGLLGWAGEAAAYGGSWAGAAKLGWLGQIQNRNWFSNFKWIWILARLWEILQGDLEEIWTLGIFPKFF